MVNLESPANGSNYLRGRVATSLRNLAAPSLTSEDRQA